MEEGAFLACNVLQQPTVFVEASSMTDAPERHHNANPKLIRQGLRDAKKPRYSDT
jgi:heptaprenylglyceryl phosphate synthase